MTPRCCLAGIDVDRVPLLKAVLYDAGLPTTVSVANMNIGEIAKIGPNLIVCDIDALVVDKLEQLRQLRFILPGATIAVYTGQLEEPWAAACHRAGASCLLSKNSSQDELSSGLRSSIRSGCFTDPRFFLASR